MNRTTGFAHIAITVTLLLVWHSLIRAGETRSAAIVSVSPKVEFWVAPEGDDQGPGTQENPFATFGRAQAAARGRSAVVRFRTGVYYLPDTVCFGPQDHDTAYTAAPGEKPVLSGGMKLDLKWEPYRDGILRAATPAGLAIDQLFVDGKRQPMARLPNFDPAVRPYGGYAADAFDKSRAARWADPVGGFIHAMHSAHWGGYHYRITGKTAEGDVAYEGGWQNNRQMGMHPQHRYVENIFEELDAPGEWFHDAKTHTLYYLPPAEVDVKTAVMEAVRLRHLVEFRGSQQEPLRNVVLRGFTFRHAGRTFMETKEPLLRSDWTIYRGGAVRLEGSEDCTIEDCEFDQLGGNAVFINGYNRRVSIRGCDLHDTGASAIAFVGDPKAVRNPLFEYEERQNYANIDKTPGPRTDDYPAECLVEDCLIRRVGVVEKQAAGVQISMSLGITVRHCSIYETSRAGININEGTFGGHTIEFCDVFDTVLETGDHGSFNSWGRDRFWGLAGTPAEELSKLAMLDSVRPTVIRNSRWRCDHGWDVDLDDGSSNYEIYNNLFLAGGLKLREGFGRKVWNNIAVNNTLHPHVWFDLSGDVVTRNIWMGAYRPAAMSESLKQWGQEVDRNLFTTSEGDSIQFLAHGCDAHSLVGDPRFVAPEQGDFRVREGSPALAVGFENFPMDQFGVQKPALKALARAPEIPRLHAEALPARPTPDAPPLPATWQGAFVRSLEGDEYSAYGVSRESGGVVLTRIAGGSPLLSAGMKPEDVVQSLNGKPVRNFAELLQATSAAAGEPLVIRVVRSQAPQQLELTDYVFTILEAAAGADFQTLPRVAHAVPIANVTAQPDTQNEPIASLYDGKLAASYGPVFANEVRRGLYKVDLGKLIAVAEIRTWSFNQNGNRGTQHFLLLGSNADSDPGWNVTDSNRFTPLAEVRAETDQPFLATGVRRAAGRPLGQFRWLVWATCPVTSLGENTAFQEFQVLPTSKAMK